VVAFPEVNRTVDMEQNTGRFVLATVVLSLLGGAVGLVGSIGLTSLSWAPFHASATQSVRDVLEREGAEQAAERSRLADAQLKAVEAAKAAGVDRLALVEAPLLALEAERDQAVSRVAEKQVELASLVQERDGLAEQVRVARAKVAADQASEAMEQQAADTKANAVAAKPPKTLTNSIGMKFVEIPAGTFLMGSADGESAEQPVHEVTITTPYYLGVTEVTNGQWLAVMGDVPSEWKNADLPVENVSWEDAVAFCSRLSGLAAERQAGREYRLPTEAEWEYACRAGTTTEYSFGDDASLLGDFAWFDDNSGLQTHPFGQKRPNGWGLYDMHGNVWEWCSDWDGDYAAGAVRDPKGPASGSARVLRGGSWLSTAGNCRSADRRRVNPSYRRSSYGFRLALSPSGASSPEAGE
jgi:formylglycine-generating enzyme required for sulfatase activity